MDAPTTTPRAPPSISAGMDYSEELLAEVDEPPEQRTKDHRLPWSSPSQPTFGKAMPNIFQRRESLLTRQLHSETEHTDEDDLAPVDPPRTLSTQSTWSVASTAELTSDDGHSVPSPAISPPLPPTAVTAGIPLTEKTLTQEPKIVEQDDHAKQPVVGSEQSVEAGLGRKRCISFACGGKRPPTSQPAPEARTSPPAAPVASPPKRKCMLKFVCPTRAGTSDKPAEKPAPPTKRPVSPPPPIRRQSSGIKADGLRGHRGSDSTITHSSPKSTRRNPSTSTPAPTAPNTRTHQRKLSNDSDASTEATRFHEFGTSDDEPEEWVQESTCHRSRLTVNDTLKKENVIRRACEEVEAEAVEEDEEEEDALDNEVDGDDELDELDGDEEETMEEEDDNDAASDEGFRTDDEEGFADSDSESEESDEEWWRPGGPSTAATSIENLDRIISRSRSDNAALASSINSASSGRASPHMPGSRRRHHRKHDDAVPIHNQHVTIDLPDSTDFVCGTLDEDRPLEQAYINNMKQREAAKHVARPQDIDPSFPTSDPEMDEEDDEDLVDPTPSDSENFMHGELEELDGDLTARRRPSPRPHLRNNLARSPPPPARHRSPAPLKRPQQQHAARSPPPTRRNQARSPPPRKAFGLSPRPARSPAPLNRFTSPPSARRTSLVASPYLDPAHHGFASRSHVTHTASLPRGRGFILSQLNTMHLEDDVDENSPIGNGDNDSPILPKRGAIDIVKGLERKRQRRKERLYAKACAKAAAKGEKAYKVKPGKGAERMREVGLELQRYHGKGEHILSM